MAASSPSNGADQATLNDFARWQTKYDVVESSSRSTKTVHAPDPDSDEPHPRCKNAGNRGLDDHRSWIPKTVTPGLAAFRRTCNEPGCASYLDDLADDRGVEFDG